MPHPDPLYLAAANRITQRIKGITNQAEDLLNTDLFEHADQDVCDHLSHLRLLSLLRAPPPTSGVQKFIRSRDLPWCSSAFDAWVYSRNLSVPNFGKDHAARIDK